MDILNFSAIVKKGSLVSTLTDPSKVLLPIGQFDERRDDDYLVSAMTVEDLLALSPGLPDFIEYNITDKTIWNNGKGNNTSNLSYGESALSSNTTGTENTAMGYSALKSNTLGDSNIALGNYTLFRNTTGYQNIGIGVGSLINNTSGYYNIASGNASLNSNTTGYGNTAIGRISMVDNTTGINNAALGLASLNGNSTGSNNTAIGTFTNSGNFSGSVILGYYATATANNQFVVGSSTANAGAVVTAAQSQTKYWEVRINGVNQRILLA